VGRLIFDESSAAASAVLNGLQLMIHRMFESIIRNLGIMLKGGTV
jgi:hypothetical protein